ncbi:MAG TPA: hypothetical protein PLS49_06885, partial [Candidatus Woesebacteria bacterium]|nr:hypothetical protein [Candidatus Woesebacteria bacterium]
ARIGTRFGYARIRTRFPPRSSCPISMRGFAIATLQRFATDSFVAASFGAFYFIAVFPTC